LNCNNLTGNVEVIAGPNSDVLPTVGTDFVAMAIITVPAGTATGNPTTGTVNPNLSSVPVP